MNIFPAIDLYEKKVVRLYKGDYSKMTVYSEDPLAVAKDFEKAGAKYIHVVDLEGAKFGTTPNLEIVEQIAKNTDLFVEIGGGIRSIETIKRYIDAGVDRVILGTAAVVDQTFLLEALKLYGDKIAVGIDVKDGYVAIKGWEEKSNYDCFEFCNLMQSYGVKYIICTDISKDGAMQGTNRLLYKQLSERYDLEITASGGVSSIEDVIALDALNLYGAIIGKAYYTGAVRLEDALEVVR
ncbi:MAG: 1-(5-phosphoribosyl)-5-[(5-phosphoribosylamino)methylideneamino]imidazole-4-carboxamide isomerase [Clostridia bacterium]|nr:1-(5-phosphoribosyl)-5-[(5-phosphoribosylamino)methylideneamino]imidazole-4-carboxamide isomerase [Clostridia bacterium]